MVDRKKPVPTLSGKGWIYDDVERLDTILSHFITSEYSQDPIHFGNITSLPHLVAMNNEDPSELCRAIERSLGAMVNRYFDAQDVRCDFRFLNKEGIQGGEYAVDIDITATSSDGKTSRLAEQFRVIDSKFERLAKLNNEERGAS